MVLKVSEAEKTAVRSSTSVVGKTQREFDSESPEQQALDVIEIEEMAALYVVLAGDDADPRAKAIYKAAQDAGRINSDGNWVGEDSEG